MATFEGVFFQRSISRFSGLLRSSMAIDLSTKTWIDSVDFAPEKASAPGAGSFSRGERRPEFGLADEIQ